ncbi:hypothetical protein [Rhizobium sp. PAMB 3182]
MPKPLEIIENDLVDLRALLKLGLYTAENAEGSEFAALRSEFVSLFYQMLDKTDHASGQHPAAWRAASDGETLQ